MLRRDRNSAVLSGVVVSFCAGLFALLALQLQKELNSRSFQSGNRKSVAKLKTEIRHVQRKFDKDVLWEPVAVDELLYNRDSVRTAEGSEANIQFDDGTELELSENSLVILDRSQDKIGIEFLKGSVFARGGGKEGQSLEIQTANGKVQVSGKDGKKGALSLSTAKTGLEVTVAEGSAKLQTANGSADLKENERGQVADTGGIKKQKLSIFPKLPVANAKFILQSSHPQEAVQFMWEAAPEVNESRLQIASDAQFAKVLFSKNIEKGKRSFAALLSEGQYYWRVQSLKNGNLEDVSDARKIRLIKHMPVRLETPVANANTSYFHETPALRFLWSTRRSLGCVDRLEMSKDSRFSSVLHPSAISRNVDATDNVKSEARFDSFEPGNYVWRVVSRYEGVGPSGDQVAEIPSLVRNFTLSQLSRLPSPELIEPKQGSSIGISDQKNTVHFQWSPVAEAGFYRLTASLDPSLKNPILNQDLSGTSWDGSLAASGRVYWSVQARISAENLTDESEPAKTKSFAVVRTGGFHLYTPKMGQEFQFLQNIPEIAFSWEKQGGANDYELQVAADEKFQNILFSENVSAVKPELKTEKAPIGDRFWRIKAVNDKGLVVGLSEVYRYHLKESPLLTAPEKISPTPKERFNSDPTPKISFEWKPIEGAKSYRIVIWKASEQNKFEKFAGEETNDPKFVEKLSDGIYEWDVRTIDQSKRLGPAGQPRVFAVREADKLPPPSVQAPTFGQHIEGRRPASVPLKWAAVQGADEYLLTISKVNNDGSEKRFLEEKVKESQYTIPNIPSGQYVWKVYGITDRKKIGNPSTSQFSIFWSGVLEAPPRLRVKTEANE